MEFVGIYVEFVLALNTAIVRVNRTFHLKMGLLGPQNVPWTLILEINLRKKPQREKDCRLSRSSGKNCSPSDSL
ncbi:hypothetical protein TNCV_2957901 [Trichonephila clavipes]|nr:hypothetical protein TNCV_2957901 [Trichonephila clavipes]